MTDETLILLSLSDMQMASFQLCVVERKNLVFKKMLILVKKATISFLVTLTSKRIIEVHIVILVYLNTII